jgi:hypothetical protein
MGGTKDWQRPNPDDGVAEADQRELGWGSSFVALIPAIEGEVWICAV